jgi:hypothetical protein
MAAHQNKQLSAVFRAFYNDSFESNHQPTIASALRFGNMFLPGKD